MLPGSSFPPAQLLATHFTCAVALSRREGITHRYSVVDWLKNKVIRREGGGAEGVRIPPNGLTGRNMLKVTTCFT